MKFSIVIPIYNVVNYLERCVKSVISQTFHDIEIILVDDGSTDGSSELTDLLKEQDERIRVIHKRNGGLSDARNVGIDQATGDYIVFLDSDDYISTKLCQALSNHIASLQPTPDIITIHGATITNEKVTAHLEYSYKDIICISGPSFLKRELSRGSMYMASWLSVFNRSFLNKNHLRFKKGLLHEDEEFTPRAFLLAKHVSNSGILGYYYVFRNNSITNHKNYELNAQHINQITYELETLYHSIHDPVLRKLLLNSLVTKRLNLYQQGKLIGNKYHDLYDNEFLLRNSHTLKNQLKSRLFTLDPSLYYRINKAYKWLGGNVK